LSDRQPEPIRLACATSNPGKLREFRLAAGAGLAIEPVPGFRGIPPCVEDGASFHANAIIKALHYSRHVAGLLFADDSGLVVDALGGAPGVRSARFSGPDATDESNNRLLLEKLRGVRDRMAHFVCVIALARQGQVLGIYAGKVTGVMLDAPSGAGGFGYDPLFYYPPFARTFGEIDEERKFSISHRGQAFRRMLRSLTAGAASAPPPARPA